MPGHAFGQIHPAIDGVPAQAAVPRLSCNSRSAASALAQLPDANAARVDALERVGALPGG